MAVRRALAGKGVAVRWAQAWPCGGHRRAPAWPCGGHRRDRVVGTGGHRRGRAMGTDMAVRQAPTWPSHTSFLNIITGHYSVFSCLFVTPVAGTHD